MSMHYLFEKYSSQQLNKRKNRVDKWTLKAIRSFKSLFPVETTPTIYVGGSLIFKRWITQSISRKTHSRQFFAQEETKVTLFVGSAGTAFNIDEHAILLSMNKSVSKCRLELASRVWHDMAKLYLIQLEGSPDHFRKYCEINDEKYFRATRLLYQYRTDEMYMKCDRIYRTADDATFYQQLGYWLWIEFFCHVLSIRMKQAVDYYHIPDRIKHEFQEFDKTFWIYVQPALMIPGYDSSELLGKYFAILYADPFIDDYRTALAGGSIQFTLPGEHKNHIYDQSYDISTIAYQPSECRGLLLKMKSMLESQIQEKDAGNVSDEWLHELGKAFYDWWFAQNKSKNEKRKHTKGNV